MQFARASTRRRESGVTEIVLQIRQMNQAITIRNSGGSTRAINSVLASDRDQRKLGRILRSASDVVRQEPRTTHLQSPVTVESAAAPILATGEFAELLGPEVENG